jgi:hypothetical protein
MKYLLPWQYDKENDRYVIRNYNDNIIQDIVYFNKIMNYWYTLSLISLDGYHTAIEAIEVAETNLSRNKEYYLISEDELPRFEQKLKSLL